ncbi:transmembrane and coiled-coil domain-containing protein 6 [Brachionichthys hirsutus]|uniref:transmembrane and coiled-coil domain-containing protein 6 n=1 Tax=Brachionichthys hirsutus TaxID=412623 RepID=UPI003604F7B2
MWRLGKVGHKASRQGTSTHEIRSKWREQEKELRQAWRERKLVSKRLILNDEDEHLEEIMDRESTEKDVVALFQNLLQRGPEREAYLKELAVALRNPSAHPTFIGQVNSMHAVIGFLTGANATCRMEAIRCLHELSHSPHPNVALACLPASPYLLTFLSGQSAKFTELCLYTLGNLCPEGDHVKEKLLAQGLVPALAHCIENHRHNHLVVEAVGFALFQLLYANDGAEKITKMVLASSLPLMVISVLTPNRRFAVAPAIECAWCLHYLASSVEHGGALLAHGALSQCVALLVALGGVIAKGKKHEGLELLICPLLRCVGNLVSSCSTENLSAHVADVRIVVVLSTIVKVYLQTQPALAKEGAWVLNNLTAHSSTFCSALMTHNLIPGLIILPFSQDINTMIMRVIANIVHNKKEFCVQLAHLGLLPALCATLRMGHHEMVTLSMDVLFMLITSAPQVAEAFVRQGGRPHLEAIQCSSEGEVRQKATHLLEHLLPGSA